MKPLSRTGMVLPVLSLTLLALLLFSSALRGQDLFAPAVNYPVESNPQDVASGDLDTDGDSDLVVVNGGSGSASVLLNNGDGTFETSVPYRVGVAPLALAIAELNGDPYPDVIVSNSGSDSLSVLFGNGDGSLAEAITYAVGAEPWGVMAGDLNGDDHVDVAVVNRGSRTWSVLLNDGTGALSLSGSYPAAGAYIEPSWLTGADLDGNPGVEIVVVKNYHNLYFREGYVEVFLNDGNASFVSDEVITLGRSSTTPIAADLDDDEDTDLAVSGFVGGSYKLSVLLNDGSGTLAPPVAHFAGHGGRAAGGDLDCDGDFDIVISDQDVYGSSISVALNNGDATFASPFTVSVGSDPRGLTTGDFDGDGDLDVAVAVMGDNAVTVTLNTTDPTAGVEAHDYSDAAPGCRLYQNYPNPFGGQTLIPYDLPEAAEVSLAVYDVRGQLVRQLVGGVQKAGASQAFWDGRDEAGQRVASGVYMCRLEAGQSVRQRRLIILR